MSTDTKTTIVSAIRAWFTIKVISLVSFETQQQRM